MFVYAWLLLLLQYVTTENLPTTSLKQNQEIKNSSSGQQSLVDTYCNRNGKTREECLPSPKSAIQRKGQLAESNSSHQQSLVDMYCYRNGKKREECLLSRNSWRNKMLKNNVEDETSKSLNMVLDHFNAHFALGSIVAPPAAPVIALVSFIVNKLVSLAIKDENPFEKGFKQINKAIAKLDAKIEQQFTQLEAKLSIADFTNEVTNAIETLTDRLADYGARSREGPKTEFLKACEKDSPSDLLLRIKRKFSKDNVNPLYKAMEADQFKSTITFMTWREICYHLMQRTIILQAFCSDAAGTSEEIRNDTIVSHNINDEFYTVVSGESAKYYYVQNPYYSDTPWGEQHVKAFTGLHEPTYIYKKDNGLTYIVTRSIISNNTKDYSPNSDWVQEYINGHRAVIERQVFCDVLSFKHLPERQDQRDIVGTMVGAVPSAATITLVDDITAKPGKTGRTGLAWSHEEYYKNITFDKAIYKWPIYELPIFRWPWTDPSKTEQTFLLIIRQKTRFGTPTLPIWH